MSSIEIKKIQCIRCGGTGKANPLTYPDQAHCCGLCRGTGKMTVKIESQK